MFFVRGDVALKVVTMRLPGNYCRQSDVEILVAFLRSMLGEHSVVHLAALNPPPRMPSSNHTPVINAEERRNGTCQQTAGCNMGQTLPITEYLGKLPARPAIRAYSI
jgi:hypothetical protein